MSVKRTVFAAAITLSSIAAMAGLGASALAGDCRIPSGLSGSQAFKDFLIPIGTAISAECVGGTTARGQAPAGSSTTVRAFHQAGTRTESGGYNSSRNFITGCLASDAVVDTVTITDNCVGVVFHDLFVFD